MCFRLYYFGLRAFLVYYQTFSQLFGIVHPYISKTATYYLLLYHEF